MKGSSVVALLATVAPAHAETSNPLGKVLQLIGDLSAKIIVEGENADKAYKEYFEWCDDTDKNTRYEIKSTKASKEKLEASIQKLNADIDVATAKIEDLANSITETEAELKGTTKLRKKEEAQFTAAEGELVSTVDTLDRAIGILDRETAKNPAAFAQIDMSSMQKMLEGITVVIDAAAISASDRTKLVALVQSSNDDDDTGAPAPDAYKHRSGGILDLLDDLKEKAESELSELRKTETAAKHTFNMLRQSMEGQLGADSKDMNEEKSGKAADEEQQGVDSGDLVVAKKQLVAAEEALKKLHFECMSLAAEHEQSIASRKEELEAIATAKKILEDTTSGAVDKVYSFLEVSSTTERKFKITWMIKHLAREQHSASLAQLASRIGAVMQYSHGADVFAKVKGLIGDMITKLEKEAAEEADEKAYCDEEMAKTEAKKSELEDAIESLSTKIDQASSKSSALKSEVKKLQAELATLAETQAKMDTIRQDEKAAYDEAKADLELGLSGVQKALEVLREYYQGGAAALVQNDATFGAFMQQPAKPEMHSKAAGAGGGIIGILEVCESDFAKNLAQVEREEAEAADDYETTTQENKVTRAAKEQDVKYNTAEFSSLDKSIVELTGDKETASTELGAVDEYYGKIKERCIAKPETYEERTKRRTAEIAGLKQALSVLEEETALVQKRSLRHSHLRA